jgi:hypothetical protein
MKLLIETSHDCFEALEHAVDLMDDHVGALRKLSLPDRADECERQALLLRGLVNRVGVVQGDR